MTLQPLPIWISLYMKKILFSFLSVHFGNQWDLPCSCWFDQPAVCRRWDTSEGSDGRIRTPGRRQDTEPIRSKVTKKCANQNQDYKKLRQSGARLQKTAPIRSKITKQCANQEQDNKKMRQSGARLQKTAPIRSAPIRSKMTKLR